MGRQRKLQGLSLEWSAKSLAPVALTEDIFEAGNKTVADVLSSVTGSEKPRVMLVADQNVVQRTESLGLAIGRYVQEHGISLAGAPVVIGGGEKIKNDDMQTVRRIVRAALDAKIGATDAIVAIGGGTLLDVAGYAAAQVRGGVGIVRVPTTPASMVDAAFASNAALDDVNIKDALRVPCRPAAVIIDTAFADTVLDGVWRGGAGELVRFAAVSDATLMKKIAKNAGALKERDAGCLFELVRDCVSGRVKNGDSGFAQWCAARLESMSGYKLPHGYAVPIAICIDCAYAVARGILEESDQEIICGALAECGALDGLPHSHHLLSQAENILYGLDAWRLATGSETVILPSGIGKSAAEGCPDRDVYKKVIKDFLAVSTNA
ncbi:MAG: iron-containing alcohol dehydrogenase [Kiritimatiellae bacterium]|nr:iron-containing alcohol dehydrogenase [Kiritimatiellia bacterium]